MDLFDYCNYEIWLFPWFFPSPQILKFSGNHGAMHRKLVRVHTVMPLKCKLLHTVMYISTLTTLSLHNCTDSIFLWLLVVISWLKSQRPKLNAYILNLMGPKKSVRGPNLGWGPRSGQPCFKRSNVVHLLFHATTSMLSLHYRCLAIWLVYLFGRIAFDELRNFFRCNWEIISQSNVLELNSYSKN